MAGEGGGEWSREEDKAFEDAIATNNSCNDDSNKDEAWWKNIACCVPTRTLEEVRRHYEMLVEDVNAIEAGRVPLPKYVGEEKDHHGHGHHRHEGSGDRRGGEVGPGVGQSKACSKAEQERRKGIPWTEEEHR